MPNQDLYVSRAGLEDLKVELAKLLEERKDITGKILSNSKNKLNNSKAVMQALSVISTKSGKIPAEAIVIDTKEVVLPKALVEEEK